MEIHFIHIITLIIMILVSLTRSLTVRNYSNRRETLLSITTNLIVIHFKNSQCVHVINGGSMENLIVFVAENYPVYNGATKTKCLNYLIAFDSIKTTQGLFYNNPTLPRNGKYLIFTTDNNTKGLQGIVERELFLDVLLCQISETGSTSLSQLGLLVGRNGHVDLQSRELSVAAFNNPPFAVKISKQEFDGVEVDVVRELAENLNFSWKIHEPKDGELWGQKNQTGHWSSGLKGELENGKTDIGIAMLYLSEEHYSSFQLTYPYTVVCLTFLVPAPKKLLGHWDALLRPLQLSTWFSFTFIAAIHTILLYVLSKRSIIACILETIRTAALVSGPQPSGPVSQRILFTTWILGCFFVAGLYSSELSSWLVAQASESPIRTFEDLTKSNVIWGRRDTDLAERLQKSSNPTLRELSQKFQLENGDDAIERNVLRGNYAVFVHVLSDGYPSGAEFLSATARSKLITLQECLASEYVAIGMRRSLPLVRAASITLRHLQEAGLLQYWQARGVRTFSSDLPGATSDLGKSLAPLSLGNLAGAFALWTLGHLAAATAFLAEVACMCAKPAG